MRIQCKDGKGESAGLTTPVPLAAATASYPLQGTPDSPQCGFSRMACVVLNAYGTCAPIVRRSIGLLRCSGMYC